MSFLTLALGFVGQHWRTVVGLVLAAILALWLASLGAGYERRRLQPQIDTARAQLAALKAEHQAASERALREKAELEAAATRAAADIVATYQEKIHAGNLALDAALERVRNNAGRVRALAPAQSAPAPCRDYEAGPEQLPQPHREFLIREAARADAVVEQLGACQRYALSLHALCSAPATP